MIILLLSQLYHTMAELHALCPKLAMSFGQHLDVEHFDNMHVSTDAML